MQTDQEIARSVTLKPIDEIAAQIGQAPRNWSITASIKPSSAIPHWSASRTTPEAS